MQCLNAVKRISKVPIEGNHSSLIMTHSHIHTYAIQIEIKTSCFLYNSKTVRNHLSIDFTDSSVTIMVIVRRMEITCNEIIFGHDGYRIVPIRVSDTTGSHLYCNVCLLAFACSDSLSIEIASSILVYHSQQKVILALDILLIDICKFEMERISRHTEFSKSGSTAFIIFCKHFCLALNYF